MFGFRNDKFTKKCRSDIKALKKRLDFIKKRHNSVLNYLTNDVALLLKNGHDIHAYVRVDGILLEQNMITCYEITEGFLDCILSNISTMENESECPDECKEAVSSLIYVAARFSDMPELRNLRNIFTKKYGDDSVKGFLVNEELVEKFKSNAPTRETKVRLMRHIANEELKIEWDSKNLEQKLFAAFVISKARKDASDNNDFVRDSENVSSHGSNNDELTKKNSHVHPRLPPTTYDDLGARIAALMREM